MEFRTLQRLQLTQKARNAKGHVVNAGTKLTFIKQMPTGEVVLRQDKKPDHTGRAYRVITTPDFLAPTKRGRPAKK